MPLRTCWRTPGSSRWTTRAREHRDGWVLVEDGLVSAVGGGAPPEAAERVDLGGAVVTPGLINTHHHLYQTLTRARAQEADLFTWLKTLYPVWARLDAEAEYAAARTGLAELALSGCTTVFDHHYVFPRGETGLIEAEVQAARELRLRIVASRGSMDLGESDRAACRPTRSWSRSTTCWPTPSGSSASCTSRATARACRSRSRRARPSRSRGRLMEESAAFARARGLLLHTHLAETVEEEAYCAELYGCRPVEYLERLGWLDGDVWCAHCVHLTDSDIDCSRRQRHRRRPLPDLEPAARRGVRTRARAARRGRPGRPRRRRVGVERAQRPRARGQAGAARGTRPRRAGSADAREALRLGTRGGAAILRRARHRLDRAGQVRRPRRLADGRARARRRRRPRRGARLARPQRVDRLYVGGEEVVRDGRLVNADETVIAAEHRRGAKVPRVTGVFDEGPAVLGLSEHDDGPLQGLSRRNRTA